MEKSLNKIKGKGDDPKIQYPPCLHVENGAVKIAKTCIRNYECRHCAFDQWLEETQEQQMPARDIEENVFALAA